MSYKISFMIVTLAFTAGHFTEASAALSTTISSQPNSNSTLSPTPQNYQGQGYQNQGYQGQPQVQMAPQQPPAQNQMTPPGYPQQAPAQPQMAPPQTPAEAKMQKDIAAAESVSNAWIKILDSGNYGASWDAASKALRGTIKRNEWTQTMDAIRHPLGNVKQRSIVDVRTAKNPPQAAPGDYMIFIYDTLFAKGEATEIVTLEAYNGNWYIYTYTISGK